MSARGSVLNHDDMGCGKTNVYLASIVMENNMRRQEPNKYPQHFTASLSLLPNATVYQQFDSIRLNWTTLIHPRIYFGLKSRVRARDMLRDFIIDKEELPGLMSEWLQQTNDPKVRTPYIASYFVPRLTCARWA